MSLKESAELKQYLDSKVLEFERPGFIKNDPICIPHRFKKKQDIEITAFWTAILAWGQRKTIINKCTELFDAMDNAPYDFILNHTENDLLKLQYFKHRTFNIVDTLHFIRFLKHHYQLQDSLEEAFCRFLNNGDETIENALVGFREYFFDFEEIPERTKKHIASPARNSACKRINMFLRWMVRSSEAGVDFGLWNNIKPSQLVCPCDVHVDRVARELGLIERKQTDWRTAAELTGNLRQFDPYDPVKYDFALFGLGVEGEI